MNWRLEWVMVDLYGGCRLVLVLRPSGPEVPEWWPVVVWDFHPVERRSGNCGGQGTVGCVKLWPWEETVSDQRGERGRMSCGLSSSDCPNGIAATRNHKDTGQNKLKAVVEGSRQKTQSSTDEKLAVTLGATWPLEGSRTLGRGFLKSELKVKFCNVQVYYTHRCDQQPVSLLCPVTIMFLSHCGERSHLFNQSFLKGNSIKIPTLDGPFSAPP